MDAITDVRVEDDDVILTLTDEATGRSLQSRQEPGGARELATALVRAAADAGETPWEGPVDASPTDLIRAAWEQLSPHDEDEWVAAAMGDLAYAYERLTGSSL